MSCKECFFCNINKDGSMDRFCLSCDSKIMVLNLNDLRYLAKKTKLKSVKKEYKKYKKICKTIYFKIHSDILCDK